jgi:hypothetical protein
VTEVYGWIGSREAKAPFLKDIRYSPLEVEPSTNIKKGTLHLPAMNSTYLSSIALKVAALDAFESLPIL